MNTAKLFSAKGGFPTFKSVLEGIISNISLGGSPQTPVFKEFPYEKSFSGAGFLIYWRRYVIYKSAQTFQLYNCSAPVA